MVSRGSLLHLAVNVSHRRVDSTQASSHNINPAFSQVQ